MRTLFYLLSLSVLLAVKPVSGQKATDLTTQWDTVRPLANPDKGWYHHMLDNGVNKYLISSDNDLKSFTGMDHLYLRLCWAYLEPEEGKFNWAAIDTIIDRYVPMGYGISFRITCKETGEAPGSVPVEIDGIRYATPYWVKQAGAKGIDRPEFGNPCWSPEWNDPVFLEKLTNFHTAFAKRYDGKPYMRYIDVGSIGDWGEGHTHSSTRIPPTVQEVKTHMDIYRSCYKKTQLIVTDALLYWNKKKEDVQELYNYAVNNGFTIRDDSPMVQFYMKNYLKTWTVSHPHFYDPLYLKKPIIFELEHYRKVKENGYWLGENGKEIITEFNYSGAEIFRNALETEHATWIGFHGYLDVWLKDNPDVTGELLNRCGYWYFPQTVTVVKAENKTLAFDMEWLNKGVAPAYAPYQLKGKLIPNDPSKKTISFLIEDSGNKNWLPGKTAAENYSVKLSDKPKGSYTLAIQLYDTKSNRPVEIGLSEKVKVENYFKLSKVNF